MNKLTVKQASCRLLFVTFVAVLLSGCALTEDTVNITYTPKENVEKIPGADLVNVSVTLIDKRTIKDKISTKKNGYGMEMAAIKADNDVSLLVSKAIEDELRNLGFKLQDGNLIINTELYKVYNDFKVGFWSGTAAAEVEMRIQIKNNIGTILYTQRIDGLYNEDGVMVMSGENAKIAIEKALQVAVAKLMKDDAFINTLLKNKG